MDYVFVAVGEATNHAATEATGSNKIELIAYFLAQ